MPDSETLIVFRILAVLAKARDPACALAAEQIADAVSLGRRNVDHSMHVLELASAVRATPTSTQPTRYSLTAYGRERLVGGFAR